MANKCCFEALDKSLKDIMGTAEKPCEQIFGGKIVVFGGDFRQILLVVSRDSHSNNVAKIESFSKWILDGGDGKILEPNDGYAEITIPPEFLLKDFVDPIEKIVTSTYPNLLENFTNPEFLQSRAILASTIEIVDEINDYITNLLPGDEKEFLSSDIIDRSEANENEAFEHLTPEFLSCLKTSSLPNHCLKLKIGKTIMLIRNLDQSEGLCNGTRLTVTRLENHVIEAKIISGYKVNFGLYFL
ncbi:uncharacterized protein LOC131634946 [Vicia villosa]|uniref:uncharacterized protein LOC131634946 n=1 Tax=Vicia villosa TaxID=3911 RepID=UPI00273BFF3B|nr:uncharacterized protein LOC131634946 [Vicia villosa]